MFDSASVGGLERRIIAVGRGTAFLGMDHRQVQRRIPLLLSNRREHTYLTVSNLEDGFLWIAAFVPDLDAMQALDHGFCHLIGDRVIPIAGETVDARADHEMGSSILGGAEEFVDVALTVADMDALCWLIHHRRGL